MTPPDAARFGNDNDSVARWGFAVCCLVALLRLSSVGLWTVLGAAVVFWAVARRCGSGGLLRSFGFLVPLVPFAGDGTLLALGLFTVMMVGRGPLIPRWSAPFVLVILAHVFAGLIIDVYALAELWRAGERGLLSFAAWWSSSAYGVPALGMALRVVLLLGLYEALVGDPEARRRIIEGLGWGALVAALVIGVTILVPGTVHLPNDTELWRHLGRHAGTFTDPNAFGVAAMLLLPLLIELGIDDKRPRKQWEFLALAGVWCVLACASGSRSFFLGVGAMIAVWIYARSRIAFSLLLIGGLGLLFVAQGVQLPEGGAPIGLQRLFESMRLDRVAETLHSRTVFWSIGAAIFVDHPWFGVGAGAFWRFVEPYSLLLGIPLGAWTDNANSYYLGILAELGLLGAIAWILAVRSLQWRSTCRAGGLTAAGVVAFLFICIVGPHLDFDEVTVLFAVLLAGVVVQRQERPNVPRAFRYPVVVVGFVVVITVVVQRLGGEWGLYPFEKDDNGRFRWTGPEAQIDLRCVSGEAALTLRAVHPGIDALPVRVEIRTRIENREVFLDSFDARTIALRCRPGGGEVGVFPDFIGARLSVSSPLVPARAFGGHDHRLLGVQLRAANP